MHFMIIASPRTGSSHLVNTLSGHPEIFCHGNVFAKKMMPIFWPKAEKPSNPDEFREGFRALRESSAEDFLKKVLSQGYGRKHVGFKIFKGQNNSILDVVIRDNSIKKVILFRRNVLASYSSTLAAMATGKWDVKRNEAVPESPKVLFEEEGFTKFHNGYLSFYRNSIKKLNAAGQSFHLMNYEEINNSYMLAALTAFVGADPQAGISERGQRKVQVKQNSSNILTRFSNQDEVEHFIAENNLMHWKHEGQTSLDSMTA